MASVVKMTGSGIEAFKTIDVGVPASSEDLESFPLLEDLRSRSPIPSLRPISPVSGLRRSPFIDGRNFMFSSRVASPFIDESVKDELNVSRDGGVPLDAGDWSRAGHSSVSMESNGCLDFGPGGISSRRPFSLICRI